MNIEIPENVYNFKKIVVNKIVQKVEAEEPEEEQPEEIYYCNYGEIECKIMEIAIANDLTRDQAKMIIAISKAECGKNYTSWLVQNCNNPGGSYYNGKFMKFETIDEGIEQMVRDLKIGYFDKGLDTLEKIQPKYAPIGAANDPDDLNSNWLPNVTWFYNELDK